MKGKSTFTREDADRIIALIRRNVLADRNEQKRLRDKIRSLGFYASDFGIGGGYTEHDFHRAVTIIGESPKTVTKPLTSVVNEAKPSVNTTGHFEKFSFPPISKSDAKILILGTMPGERSLSLNQYYGHGGNQFWKIMFECFSQPYNEDYSVKEQLLLDNGIALWDVLQYCESKGSSDNAIKAEIPNDFAKFFKEYPAIEIVLFNGKNAFGYYEKFVGFSEDKEYKVLPSTSPANTWMTKEEKMEEWKQIIIAVLAVMKSFT